MPFLAVRVLTKLRDPLCGLVGKGTHFPPPTPRLFWALRFFISPFHRKVRRIRRCRSLAGELGADDLGHVPPVAVRGVPVRGRGGAGGLSSLASEAGARGGF